MNECSLRAGFWVLGRADQIIVHDSVVLQAFVCRHCVIINYSPHTRTPHAKARCRRHRAVDGCDSPVAPVLQLSFPVAGVAHWHRIPHRSGPIPRLISRSLQIWNPNPTASKRAVFHKAEEFFQKPAILSTLDGRHYSAGHVAPEDGNICRCLLQSALQQLYRDSRSTWSQPRNDRWDQAFRSRL